MRGSFREIWATNDLEEAPKRKTMRRKGRPIRPREESRKSPDFGETRPKKKGTREKKEGQPVRGGGHGRKNV